MRLGTLTRYFNLQLIRDVSISKTFNYYKIRRCYDFASFKEPGRVARPEMHAEPVIYFRRQILLHSR
jgi:hypothetical protein